MDNEQQDARKRAETNDGIAGAPTQTQGKVRAQSCGEYDARTGMMARSSRYKTEMCRSFKETGECRYGRKCQYAHGPLELRAVERHPRYKTEMCKAYHQQGYCSYGTRCHFVHDEAPSMHQFSSNPVHAPGLFYRLLPVPQSPAPNSVLPQAFTPPAPPQTVDTPSQSQSQSQNQNQSQTQTQTQSDSAYSSSTALF